MTALENRRPSIPMSLRFAPIQLLPTHHVQSQVLQEGIRCLEKLHRFIAQDVSMKLLDPWQ